MSLFILILKLAFPISIALNERKYIRDVYPYRGYLPTAMDTVMIGLHEMTDLSIGLKLFFSFLSFQFCKLEVQKKTVEIYA